MYTSDRAARNGGNSSAAGAYLLASVCCALFGAVYECFGHGVYSGCMICAFLFPLLLGALPFSLLRKRGRPLKGGIAAELIHAGVAALTVGSVIQGVLEIYGTTNPLVTVYWIAGGALTAAGWTAEIFSAAKDRGGDRGSA